MPGPLDGLRAAIEQRNQLLPPPSQPQAPPMPQGQMPPADRAMFGLQTGIQPNPAAQDIELPVPLEELMQRSQAITGPLYSDSEVDPRLVQNRDYYRAHPNAK